MNEALDKLEEEEHRISVSETKVDTIEGKIGELEQKGEQLQNDISRVSLLCPFIL